MIFLNFLSLLSIFSPEHAIKINVKAPWNQPPLYDQFFMAIRKYSLSSAKQFLLLTLEHQEKIDDIDFIQEMAIHSLPEGVFNFINSSVFLGSYIPTAIFHGFSKDQCLSKLRSEPDVRYSIDFVNQGTDNLNSDPSIIIANLHIKEDADIVYDKLKKDESFILRLIPPQGTYGISLKGYGFEMRPFRYSMEYSGKNTDEGTISHGISGLNDTTTLTAPENPIPTQVENPYRDLDPHLSSYISKLRERGLTLPHIMRDLSANWPLHINEIIQTEILPELEGEMNTIYVHPMETINGRLIEPSKEDAFTILRTIREEMIINQNLKALNVTEEDIHHLLSYSLPSPGSPAIELDAHFIKYFNDLEHDPVYSSFSEETTELFKFPMALPQFKRNYFNYVLVINPSEPLQFTTLFPLINMLNQRFPIRIGLLPFFDVSDPTSRKLGVIFYHIYSKNPTLALHFLSHLYTDKNIDPNNGRILFINDSIIYEAYEDSRKYTNIIPWEDISSLLHSNSEEFKMLKETNAYIRFSHVPFPSLVINGKTLPPYIDQNSHIRIFSDFLNRVQMGINSRENHILPPSIDDIISDEVHLPFINRRIFNDDISSINLLSFDADTQLDYINTILSYGNSSTSYSDYCIFFTKNKYDLQAFKNYQSEIYQGNFLMILNPTNFDRFLPPGIDKRNLYIMNGRIYEHFNPKNFRMTELWNHIYVKSHISSITEISSPSAEFYSSTLLNTFFSQHINRLQSPLERISDSSPRFYHSSNNCSIHYEIYSDPYSQEFQTKAELYHYIEKSGLASVDMFMFSNPYSDNSSLFSYFRSSLSEDSIVFTMLEDSTTYASTQFAPNSWMIESLSADTDMNNILPSTLPPGITQGSYALSSIVVEGHSTTFVYPDDNTKSHKAFLKSKLVPSTGARLTLEQGPATSVMAHRGYWQLQAQPGPHIISSLRPSAVLSRVEVTGFADYMLDVHAPKIDKPPGPRSLDNVSRVDVFAVAGGHLYERLVKIMMISVRRHTEAKLKFWLLQNFLSPQFKAMMENMAKEYGFEYEFVSYKWPLWIRAQKERQRQIWSNKVLFLDVLFPQDLDRVIYVDSDQIVRTDLLELMRMDFGKAPYAFTPMCDSREETEPFRFWKTGYWKEKLGDKYKYHISALFAVDLRKLREMGAADDLRESYQGLSADPASLANLDQDLPNNLQELVPIYSLPQNWLWCETWCSDETMDEAKTIDLCNNPLTKLPKLKIAQERVEEWPGLDEEVRKISVAADAYEKYFFQKNNKN